MNGSPYAVMHHGNSLSIRHEDTGRCVLCPTATGLTWHHVFGRSAPVKVRLCEPCHVRYHREMDTLKPGRTVRRVLSAVASALAREPVRQ